jgi:zinc transport system permease protein
LSVIGAIVLFYKELFALTFDEEAARVQGVPVDLLNLLVTLLAAITVVVAMRVVGVLLTSALIVIPAVTALRIAHSFRGALWIAIGASVTAVLAGMTMAFYFDLAAGGAIVLTAIALFAATSPLARRRA